MAFLPDGVLPGSDFYFFTPSEIAVRNLYYFTSVGRFICDNNYRVERDNYGNYLLLLVESGTMVVKTCGKTYTLNAGEAAFIDCHVPHVYYSVDAVDFIWLHFKGMNTSFMYEAITSQIYHEPIFKPLNYKQLHKQMINIIFTNKYAHYNIEYRDSLRIYEILISLLCGTNAKTLVAGQNLSEETASPLVDKVIRFIEEHIAEDLPVSRLADYAGLSESHFTRKFRAAMNSSPKEYVIRRRMNRAKFLLKTTSTPIKEIAFQVGFNSESHFTNTFTALNGMSPKRFRVYKI